MGKPKIIHDELDTRTAMIEAQMEFNAEQEKCPVSLYKTDYNNLSDLSKFVDEYNKAQAMINECKAFYKSFLKSKLLTYSQLTNTLYKKDVYKFYSFKLKSKPADILYKDVIKHFNFNINSNFNGVYVYGGISAIINLTEMLAALELAENYKKDPEKLAYPVIRSFYRHPEIKDIIFKESNIVYDVYGYPDSNNTLKTHIEFKTDDEYEKYARDMHKIIDNDWNIYKKKWLPLVLDYIGYDNIIKADISYMIYDNAYDIMQTAKRDELLKVQKSAAKIKKVNKKYEEELTNLTNFLKSSIEIDLNDIYDHDYIIKLFESIILHDGIGHWGELQPENMPINDKLKEYVKHKISDSLQACQNVINKYADYDTENLYIIQNNEAILYCTSSDIDNDKVDIQINGRKLICIFSETAEQRKMCSRYTDCIEVKKQITFSIDTNELIEYKKFENKYQVTHDRY